jgi:LPS sulfotransferase NodH
MTIVRERAQWEAFFARTGIKPLRIIYERFLEDPSSYVELVARLVDIEHPVVDQRRVEIAIQRDAVTEEWAQRFRAENGDPNVSDDLFPDLPPLVRKICSGFGRYRDLLRTRLP